jgi:hypothetical protein
VVSARRLAATLLAVVAATVAGASGISCAGILGFERLSADEADTGVGPKPDAGADGPVTPEAGDTCAHARWPENKRALSGGTTRFVNAIRLLDLGIANGDAGTVPPAPGFDLDGFCTTEEGKNSCKTPQRGRNFDLYVKDKDEHGLDNAGFELVRFMALLGDAFDPVKVNQRLTLGEFGGVMVVSGYNGEANDDVVVAEWYPSLGLERPANGLAPDGGFIPIGAVVPPRFDSTDRWARDTTYRLQAASNATLFTDSAAYVADGKLVARFPQFAVAISVPDNVQRLDIQIAEAVFVADIVAEDADAGAHRYTLRNIVLGGRWASKDILAAVRPLYVPRTGLFVCRDAEGIYKLVKDTMCVARDIALHGSAPADAPCDALSVGLRSEAYFVDDYGGWRDRPDAGAPCVDAAAPAGDDCP